MFMLELFKNTCDLSHKDGFYWLRNSAQDKALGRMTKKSIKVDESQVRRGPTDSTVPQAIDSTHF